MCYLFWILGIYTVIIAGVTGSQLLLNDVTSARNCYHCEEQTDRNGTSSACENQPLPTIECPVDKQYCVTEASSSTDFKSSLHCAAKTTPSILYMPNTSGETYRITCICDWNLCNRPLPELFVRELKEFSSQTFNFTNITDVTDIFLNTSKAYKNFNNKTNYFNDVCSSSVNVLDLNNTEVSTINTDSLPVLKLNLPTNFNVSKSVDSPRAEALKHEVTAPSDDEEDEGEGSGGWGDEGRSQRRPAPDAPSSYLPAHENKGSCLFINVIVMSTLILYFII